MYKVIQVIQDLPLDEDNPLRGRHFLLFDEKNGLEIEEFDIDDAFRGMW